MGATTHREIQSHGQQERGVTEQQPCMQAPAVQGVFLPGIPILRIFQIQGIAHCQTRTKTARALDPVVFACAMPMPALALENP